MRVALAAVTLAVVLSGCSLSVGAGAAAKVGGRSDLASPDCDSFESCDVRYREALALDQGCHDQGDDCETEDHAAAASYEALAEQTERELGALRVEAEQRDAAVVQAEQAADAAEFEPRNECSKQSHPPEQAPVTRHGNGWFESDPEPALR